MPELRKDPILDRWVIISSERGERPSDFSRVEDCCHPSDSPFSPGNEHMTPPEISAIRKPGTQPNAPGWQLRIIPNKYPALTMNTPRTCASDAFYERRPGVGAHEVIVETPVSGVSLGDMDVEMVIAMLRAYKERILAHKDNPELQYVIIFKNHGADAGATLVHPHSQLVATATVPERVAMELKGSQSFHDRHQRCIYCEMIDREDSDMLRVVCSNRAFTAFIPFAARLPYEIWLAPRKHLSHFEDISDQLLRALAEVLITVFKKINKLLDYPAYNFVLHSTPLHVPQNSFYHWHVEILPRTNKMAGFEWGTDVHINPMLPEDAARQLKDIAV